MLIYGQTAIIIYARTYLPADGKEQEKQPGKYDSPTTQDKQLIKVNSIDGLDHGEIMPDDDDDDVPNEVDDYLMEDGDSTGSLSNTPSRNGLRSSIKETFKNVTSKTSSRVISLAYFIFHALSSVCTYVPMIVPDCFESACTNDYTTFNDRLQTMIKILNVRITVVLIMDILNYSLENVRKHCINWNDKRNSCDVSDCDYLY